MIIYKMDNKKLWQAFLQYPDISTDTRNIKKNSIFFALKGDNFNGNTFAQNALDQGCSFAVIDEPAFNVNDKMILVENVLYSLQQLAIHYRKTLKIPFIGITGTNGKTTTKELIAAALSSKFNVLSTKGNLNNHIGVPLTILSIKPETEIAVIEMGANHPGEIAFLCNIAFPDFGIITNIGKAHLEGFGGFEGVKKTKKELYDFIKNQNNGKLFVNADNPLLMEFSENIQKITYGKNGDFCKGILNQKMQKLNFQFLFKDITHDVQTQLIGDYNFENALAAVCIALYFGCSPEEITKKLHDYNPTNNRSQLMQTPKNTLYIDAYNANPSSMKASLENFSKTEAFHKLLILGDMKELGVDAESEHQHIIDMVNELSFKDALFVGNVFSELAAKNNLISFPSVEDLIDHIKNYPISDKSILIKGSRGIQLEKIIPYL